MKGKAIGRGCAGVLALVFFTMTFVPYLPVTKKTYGAVSFGQGELVYPDELVAVWDSLAAQEGVDMERTDFIGHMTRTYPNPEIAVYKQQTSVSPGGKWKDYQYRNMYCISHSRELQENPNMNIETTAVWYIKKEPYTLQSLPDFVKQNTADEYCRRLNFLIMAYAADHEAYQNGVNSDPVAGTANYYLCQAFCTCAEKAEFTGDREQDWERYRQCAAGIADRYHPSALGSSQVYSDMTAKMEKVFDRIWNTAKLSADCVKSSDSGYLFQPAIALEEDGMYHAKYRLTSETRRFFASSSIVLHGDWNYEFTEDTIDFRSETGQMPPEGFLAEINLGNANGIVRRMIGEESVRELHMPVKLGNRWSLTFAQGNLLANLKEGFKILIGSPSEGEPGMPTAESVSVARYKHTEYWQADYQVNLRKLDAETGEPLADVWFDILEAFDDSQLEGSLLEDDNWDNDKGSQFLRWEGWDAPYGDGKGGDPCEKDQEMTGEDGWLTQMTSLGAGQLYPMDSHAHRDTKYYSYTKGYCGGHPEPDEEDEEAWEEYERQIEICRKLMAEGGFYHSLDGRGREMLKEDRNRHYEAFISLTYDYSAYELAARKGYIRHNQDWIHGPFEDVFDGIHKDTIPIETVTMHSSQYYAAAGKNVSEVSLSAKDVQRVQEIDMSDSAQNEHVTATDSNARGENGETKEDRETEVEGETASDDPWILDEDPWDEEENEIEEDEIGEKKIKEDQIVMPGIVRAVSSVKEQKNSGKATDSDWLLRVPAGEELSERAAGKQVIRGRQRIGQKVRSQVDFRDSQIEKVPPADSGYSGYEEKVWTFMVYDRRTEGEVHINKRDLLLEKGESRLYDSYGDTQGDGTLEGAVYGLFAAEDIVHPDGRTGVIFQKGNLVAMAATDKNGDASFMAITESPGTEYDYLSGGTKSTGFTGPSNQQEPVNGNCWIGRPLFLGAYNVRELIRSEGYELSVYGVNGEISNRNYWQAREEGESGGKVWTESVEGNILKIEDTGKEESVTEITLASEGTVYGYDVFIKNIDLAAGPSFYRTEKGKKEIYREWEEARTGYVPVLADPGTRVVIGGKNVEAEAGDKISLPNGETIVVNRVTKTAVTPERIYVTGEKGAIPTFDLQYIPELTGARTDDEEKFIEDCNEAFAEIGLINVGKESPYLLVELEEDKRRWPQNLYDFLAKEETPAFNGASLERIIRRGEKNYAVVRYAFLSKQKAVPVAYSASDQTFYIQYAVNFWDGTEGYLYRGYPLSELDPEDYEKGTHLYRWIRVRNEKPVKQAMDFYEDLSDLTYQENQQFKSYWVYDEGDFLRADDGNIYQKEQIYYEKCSGYETVETVSYTEIAAQYEDEKGTWRIHVEPEQIPANGRITISIRYQDRFAGGQERIAVTAVPSVNLDDTYIEPVTLIYPGQYAVWEDGGTRKRPVRVRERAIVQKVKVTKKTEGEPEDAVMGKADNFRFKIYLLSNLTGLFRAEDGTVVWQNRQGEEKTEEQVKEENHVFPGIVRKIYTKAYHETDPLYYRSQDAVIANERLYGYEDGLISESQNRGYTALLETGEAPGENVEDLQAQRKYNYEKFFDALAVANHDKWDDGAPTYSSWQPIGNKANRSQAAVENARVSDHVRQFAVDWYLDDEVKKQKKEKTSYSDELLDRALQEAIIKAENYLKPFFAYDLDEIYAIAWDEEKGGGSDGDIFTLSADKLCAADSGCYGISAYLPYGTYVAVEQQPMYAGTEYEKNLHDFKNKHYRTDEPKVLTLPSVCADDGITQAGQGDMGEDYVYNAFLSEEEEEGRYKIRFREENHVIKAHSHQGDFEIYKYGLSLGRICNGVPTTPGEGDYFALVQEEYKPQKNYYNEMDDRMTGEANFYLTEGQSGRAGIAADYRYSSVSEQKGDGYVCGQQTAYEGKYAPMLVPWSIEAPEENETKGNGGDLFVGFCPVDFSNPFFMAGLRLEKLDGETHENILHDGAVFAIYEAKRDLSPDGSGQVLFYEEDTKVYGSKEFLESMRAFSIDPVIAAGEDANITNDLYQGIIPAGTPICEKSKRIAMETEGEKEIFRSYATIYGGSGEDGQTKLLQTVGYWETPQPLKAGVYVICEEKAPYGYVRSRPVAVEIYSDKVTYYKEGNKDSRVLSVLYSERSGDLTEGGENQGKWPVIGKARINIENEPIKLTVEKRKESAKNQANTTEDKTVSYKISGRIDGSLADIGGNPDYVYAYRNGNYLGYAWKKGTLEYLASRKAAGEQVEIAYEGEVFSGYGYVTRSLGTANDENPYVAGAKMALYDALKLVPVGDTQGHDLEGLVVQRDSINNVTRMYVREGYAGEKTQWIQEGNQWQAVIGQRRDTDILYYDLDDLDMLASERIDGRQIVFGYGRNHEKIPVSMLESDKVNFAKTDKDYSLFAFKGGTPYLEFAGGDFTKLAYSAKDKRITAGEGTRVYHLDREGNRDCLVDPYTGMAYVELPADKDNNQTVMVWPVKVYKDRYGNVTARDKIMTCRAATIGENQDDYREEERLEIKNNSGREIPVSDYPSYLHEESGSVTGTWKSENTGESQQEITIPAGNSLHNRDGEVLINRNNGSFAKELEAVYDSHGLPKYYEKSQETYEKGTNLYDRNDDFVRYKDSDHLREYNHNAYELLRQEKLSHRWGEGYILENVWITSDKTPNDPFVDPITDGQADVLKRIPAGNYIMEELESPKGYVKSMPIAVVVGETAMPQHAVMVDKTTKVEIAKIDGVKSQEIPVLGINQDKTTREIGKTAEGMGRYTYKPVAGAEIALYKAKRVYSAKEEKGYFLEKAEEKPLLYDSTDSRVSSPQKAEARWITGEQPIYVEGIPAGDYILEEIHTPAGYIASAPVEVEITNTEEVQTVVMYEDHTKVEIEKYTWEDTERKLLSGAGFTLYEAIVDPSGQVVMNGEKPEYDPQKITDMWFSSDLHEYTGFMPAFETMYRNIGAKENATVAWEENGRHHTARLISLSQIDSAVSGGEKTIYPTSAALLFRTDEGKDIRIYVYGEKENRSGRDFTFEYQFDYRKLPTINEQAVSYLTLDGTRRFDYLPSGAKYVLVETKVLEGCAKAEDRVIDVPDTRDVWRYSVENTKGRLIVSKVLEGGESELAGACMELYRAGNEGELIQEKNCLAASWITGEDGVYTRLDWLNGRILPGYKEGDLKPHEIYGLPDGIYWLVEKESPEYYTLSEPVRIDYRKEEEPGMIRVIDMTVTGSIKVRKTDKDGNLLEGAVFELAAYGERNGRTPVFTKTLSDTKGIVWMKDLPVGRKEENGHISPYFYKLREIRPPDGYAVNTELLTFHFAPRKDGMSYEAGEEAVWEGTIVNEKTKVTFGKKNFGVMGMPETGRFLAGAEFALYEITGRDEADNLVYDEASPWAKWVTEEGKEQELEGLIAGHAYLLKEEKAPKGYQLTEPIVFLLSMDGRKICGVSNRLNTVTVNYINSPGQTNDGIVSDQDNPDQDSIQSVIVKGRYAVGTKYEMYDSSGHLAAWWPGSRDGHMLYRENGPEEGKIYTVTEKTRYSDGTETITGQRTAFLYYDPQETSHVPGRETRQVELSLADKEGIVKASFYPDEIIQEKVIINDISPEELSAVLQNRNGQAGLALDPGQVIFGTVTCVNTSGQITDMELFVELHGEKVVLDPGEGVLSENQLIYRLKDVCPGESRNVSFAFEADEGRLSVCADVTLKYKGNTVAAVKETPLLQKNCLTVYHELTGSGKEIFADEESRFEIRLYMENGEELKGRYAYEGSRSGFLQSGDIITLTGNEYVTINPGVYRNVCYQVTPKEEGKEMTETNVRGEIEARGSCAAFSRKVQDTSKRQIFRKGETYLLTETTMYTDGTTWESNKLMISLDERASVSGMVAADRQTSVKISKKDKTNGQELPGNQLSIKDKDGKEMISWISGTKPYKIPGVLNAGEIYVLEEEHPANGFSRAQKITFTVGQETGENLIVMENEPTRAEILKIDAITQKPLPGALLQIKDSQGNTLEQWVSQTDAHEIVGKLTAGEIYYIEEVKAPEGYDRCARKEFQMPEEPAGIRQCLENRKKEGEDPPKKPEEPERPKEPEKPGESEDHGGNRLPGKKEPSENAKEPDKTKKPPQDVGPELSESKHPGWIRAYYEVQAAMDGRDFFDGRSDLVLTLSPTGDDSCRIWYAAVLILSSLIMVAILLKQYYEKNQGN